MDTRLKVPLFKGDLAVRYGLGSPRLKKRGVAELRYDLVIERVKGVHHTSIINWVKQVGELLPNAYVPETIPLVGELDELETFVGSKKTKFGRQ